MADDVELDEDEVQGLKFFVRLLPLLDRLHKVGCKRDVAGNRELFYDDYVKLVLLYLFNPLINSMKLLQQASAMKKVSAKLGIKRFSAGSFSEAPAVFDPQMLKSVIAELAGELRPLATDPRLSEVKHLVTLADATILTALPKLVETIYNRQKNGGKVMHGWRLHTHLVLGAAIPELIDRTSAAGSGTCERRHLLAHLLPGRCYVLDRGFHDASLFNAIHAIGSSYVCRARDNLAPQVRQERELSQASLDGGVVRDALVSISVNCPHPSDHVLRLVEGDAPVHPKRSRRGMIPSTGKISILTNLLDEPPELILLIYRYRWTIELFFRMLKQLLGCRHLLSQRPEGIDIQIYCALIAVMLIQLQTGKKPNKVNLFVLGMYLAGWASEQEVLAALNRPDNTGIKQRAKDELWKKLGF